MRIRGAKNSKRDCQKGIFIMARNEVTSKGVGKKASKLLRKSRSKLVKSVAGSDLTQRPDRKRRKRRK